MSCYLLSTELQACRPWVCRVCHGTPRFWQISYLTLFQQGGDRLCPSNYYWHTRIFTPSDGPDEDNFLNSHICEFSQTPPLITRLKINSHSGDINILRRTILSSLVINFLIFRQCGVSITGQMRECFSTYALNSQHVHCTYIMY